MRLRKVQQRKRSVRIAEGTVRAAVIVRITEGTARALVMLGGKGRHKGAVEMLTVKMTYTKLQTAELGRRALESHCGKSETES